MLIQPQLKNEPYGFANTAIDNPAIFLAFNSAGYEYLRIGLVTTKQGKVRSDNLPDHPNLRYFL